MDAEKCRKEFYSRLPLLTKELGLKYSKGSFRAYQRMGDILWSADFLCDFFLRNGQLEVTATDRLKPRSFDEVQFSIIEPGDRRQLTDLQRVTAAFAAKSFVISKTVYRLSGDDPDVIEGEAREILRGIIKERDDFLGSPALAQGLPAYLMEGWEKNPYEAGLAYLCREDYDAAKRCFQRAGESGRYEQVSIGRAGRYLHLVFIDYCRAMMEGVPWSEELAVRGFDSLCG